MSNNNSNAEPEEEQATWGEWFRGNWYWVLPVLLVLIAGIVAAIVWYMRSGPVTTAAAPSLQFSQPPVPQSVHVAQAAPQSVTQPPVPQSVPMAPQPPAPQSVPVTPVSQTAPAAAPSAAVQQLAARYNRPLPLVNPNVPKNAVGVTVDDFESYRQMYPNLQPLISRGISYLTLPDGSAVASYVPPPPL